jgi:hypothetical protein
MKRVVIVHCWDGTPSYCWYPWTKAQLEEKGFMVEVPAMPDTSHPNLTAWLPKLKKVIGSPDEDLFLIGHSVGVITILRYLEQLSPDAKVGGLVLVAGFTDPLGFEQLESYFTKPVDFEAIKSHIAKGSILIHSDNDQYVPVRYGEGLKNKLNAKLIVLKNMGHFSGAVDKEDSCTELPEIVKAILGLEG